MPTILIDADILTYSIACSAEQSFYICGGGQYKRKGYAEKIATDKGLTVKKRVNIDSPSVLKERLDVKLQQIYEDLGTRNSQLYITASKVEGNFRSKVATILPYKGNRSAAIKPFHYRNIRKLLVSEYGAVVVTGQEADDAIAIKHTELIGTEKKYDRSYIATIDKDLQTVAGQHYHLNTRRISFVDEDQALKTFYRQILSGDATDNIPGLYKLLTVNNRLDEANKLKYSHYLSRFTEDTLDYSPEDTYNYVLGMYEEYGYGPKEIHEIGDLLHLRRYEGQIWSKDK